MWRYETELYHPIITAEMRLMRRERRNARVATVFRSRAGPRWMLRCMEIWKDYKLARIRLKARLVRVLMERVKERVRPAMKIWKTHTVVHRSACLCQRLMRGASARRLVQAIRCIHVCATLIQSAARGWMARRRYGAMLRRRDLSVLTIQRCPPLFCLLSPEQFCKSLLLFSS
jgi:hypothetical protein